MAGVCLAILLGTAESEARERVDRATVAYKLGQFAEALVEYEQAYRLVQAPGLLFNLGQCHRALKHHDRALFFLRGYLRDKPHANNRGLVEQLIGEEEAALAAETSSVGATSAPASAPVLVTITPLPTPTPASAPAPAVEATPAWYTRWWVWTIVGVAVAGAAAGTAVALSRNPYSLGVVDRQ